ncbi:DUF4013 domain-containing protein [Salinirubrum litoreum]|uniref:DUF4013 domain-containing protein n=1 Tax=Salinirubrum litoreum TaxID=1126234 RepID=A0ABD5RA39_9EURY|nr:DUF4013 domain-containing protein [Salinirubrum litoreum]
MFGDALSTPAKTSDAAVTVLIGGVLTLFATVGLVGLTVALVATPLALLAVPVALLPAFVLRGYYVAVLDAGAHREPGAPSIVRWGTLLSDGVKSVLVSAGYLLPAVLLVALGVAALVALVPPEVADPATSPSPSAVESSVSDARALGVLTVLVLGSLLLLGYALLYAYLRPAALAVFAVSGSLREAFRLGRVRAVAGTGDYAVGWLLAGLLLVVGGLFVVPLSVLLVGFFLLFYLQVVAHSLYGRGASDVLVPEAGSTGDDGADDTETADDPDEAADVDADDSDVDDSGDDGDLPSEWAVTSADTDEVDDDAGTDGAPDTDDQTDTDETTDSDHEAVDADDSLTDWDDVSAAVELSASADTDDANGTTAGAVQSAGGVSAAVQSGRGVTLDETDHAADEAPLDDSAADVAADPETETETETETDSKTDTDTETETDPFDWGPADGR